MPVRVNLRQLEDREIRLKGELPAGELDLDDPKELAHVRQPLRYDLTAQKVGEAILAQGRLRLTLECECARCLKPFKQALEIADWAVHLELEGEEKVEIEDDTVDLTPFIREDILLEFPQHPLCGTDCAGLPNRSEQKKKSSGSSQAGRPSDWSELDKLTF